MGALGENIAANFQEILGRIERAARRAGRSANEITLVGVSKTFPAEGIRKAHAAGVRHFGENRIQEWEKKEAGVRDLNATWHLIGHVQSNKAARAARLFHAVDSVDSAGVARKLANAFAESPEARGGKRLRVLIEARIADEAAKSGASEAEITAIAESILGWPQLELRGLMCIPPYFEEPGRARPFFHKLRAMRDELAKRIGRELPVLSMGMSHDFEVAIEEGASEVRVGTALFGARSAGKSEGAV